MPFLDKENKINRLWSYCFLYHEGSYSGNMVSPFVAVR
jgi:hypothetical protein